MAATQHPKDTKSVTRSVSTSQPKTYLVSGAGSGIGRAIAFRIASESPEHRVILLGRDEAKLEQVRVELPRASEHRVLAADTRHPKALHAAFQRADLASLNLTGIVANAGIGGENRYGERDRWHEVLETNLTGTYVLVNEALPALRKSQEPFKHVVIVSSVLARIGVPGYSAYCASKAGLLGLARSWAAELARDRILVNAICPGWVDTDMARSGIRGYAELTGMSYEDAFREQMRAVPLGKMSQPEEVAGLVAYLMSPEQRSMTGQTLDFNNGAVMP